MEFFESRIRPLNKADGENSFFGFSDTAARRHCRRTCAEAGLSSVYSAVMKRRSAGKLFCFPTGRKVFPTKQSTIFKSEYEKSIIPLFWSGRIYHLASRRYGARDRSSRLSRRATAPVSTAAGWVIYAYHEGAAVFLSPEIANFLLSPDTR